MTMMIIKYRNIYYALKGHGKNFPTKRKIIIDKILRAYI